MTLNYIWISFFLIAFFVAAIQAIFFGNLGIFNNIFEQTYSMSKTAFEISIGLTGVMAFWLGMMRIAEKGGAIAILSRLVAPFFQRIFPEIPTKHPAMGAILMNFSANMLGLDNAATALGLNAMKELQSLNPKKDTASNAQIMFLVLNTSSIMLIPVTIMLYRAELGAENPADVFLPILLATICSTLAGLIVVSIYQRINLLQPVLLISLFILVLFVTTVVVVVTELSQADTQTYSTFIGSFIIVGLISLFIGLGARKKLNLFDEFIEGAKQGFRVAVDIIPYLVAMLVAIAVFRASGAFDILMTGIRYLVELTQINSDFVEALPTAMMKPLSGGGARSMMIDTMKTFGADSFVGRLSAIMQGSTETTFYIIAVYFGSIKIKNTRYAITCGLIADFVGIIAAIIIAYLFFGS
jgi:spore maturation protein SpmA